MNSKNRSRTRAFIVPALALGIGLGLALVGFRSSAHQENTPLIQPSNQTLSLQVDIENVAQKIRPSVVAITSKSPLRSFQQDSMILPFGGLGFPPVPGQQIPGQQPQTIPQFPQQQIASGSGVIVRSDGYILTNDHVVAGATSVTVRLLDGRTFVGKVYQDPRSDLAVVKIDANNLPTMQFADSNDVKVGEFALAFGSPFDLSDTMTMGIVSSLHRHATISDGSTQRYYPSLIQTDASINPGNSGGPLVDVYGRMIGVNTAIESQTGGNVGIGFAIPSNTARYIMDRLISTGKVVYGYMGVVPQSLTYNEKQQDGVQNGALITEVVDNSPAAKAGMQVGDVVTSFDGKPISDDVTLRQLAAHTVPGTTVPVDVRRNGQNVTLQMTVGSLPDTMDAQAQPQAQGKARGKLGVEIGDVSDPTVRQQFGYKPDVKSGAVIVQVYPNSPAMQAGLQPGDIVINLNGKPIATAQQFSDAIANLPSGSKVILIVKRYGGGMGTTDRIPVILF